MWGARLADALEYLLAALTEGGQRRSVAESV